MDEAGTELGPLVLVRAGDADAGGGERASVPGAGGLRDSVSANALLFGSTEVTGVITDTEKHEPSPAIAGAPDVVDGRAGAPKAHVGILGRSVEYQGDLGQPEADVLCQHESNTQRHEDAVRTAAQRHTYRPDVDGLRALAVGAVVVCHYFPARLPGGFVGVDIFFVISGYLISGVLSRGVEAGTFTYASFYSKRARRIFPAMLVVFSTTLLMGVALVRPSQLPSPLPRRISVACNATR